MKAILLFVCCLAIVATAYGRTFPRSGLAHLDLIQARPSDGPHLSLTEGLFQELKKVLAYIAKAGLDAVHEFKKELDRLMEDVAKKAEELLQLANGSINDYLQEAKQNLTAYGDQVAECVVPAVGKLEKIAAISQENSKKCYDDLKARVKILGDNAAEHVSFEVAKVEEIQQIAANCEAENTKLVDKVKCVLDHFDETTAIVQEMISDVGKLLAETTQELVSLTNDTRGCLLDVVRMSRNEVDKVLKEVHECLHEQNTVPSL
ncbi:uncharacterized protein LOC135703231 [Ochlerotatus camptorhynchus]|uniref:uncharacterized protein LOC135703231 n=1 Tax=Ochlerotatus camptorhynchus TaxID=644619 RepID=UPI0031E003FC